MSLPFPEEERIFVLKDETRLGPYNREELLERVDRGEIDYEDLCLRDSAHECERVKELLDWDENASSSPTKTEENIADHFAPDVSKAPPKNSAPPETHAKPQENSEEPPKDQENDGPPSDPRLILYRGHPSIISFPKALLTIIGGLGLGIWLNQYSGWILLGGLCIALLGISYIILERASAVYLVSPRRIEQQNGLFAKSSREAQIHDIRAINVHRPGFLGIIGVGDIEFDTAGDGIEVRFDRVWKAQRVKGLVRRLQDAE